MSLRSKPLERYRVDRGHSALVAGGSARKPASHPSKPRSGLPGTRTRRLVHKEKTGWSCKKEKRRA